MENRFLNILLVEDEEAHRELISRVFQKFTEKYNLTFAQDLKTAIEMLGSTTPDLVITDMVLPDGKGIDILTSFNSNPHFPLVVMTSHGNEEMAVQAIKFGALDYVVKSESTFRDLPKISDRAIREWEHIVQRRAAELALKENEEKYRTLFEMESDALAMVDVETGNLLDVNRAFLDLYQFTRDEVLSMKRIDFCAAPGQFSEPVSNRESKAPVFWHKKKDGTIFPTEISSNLFTYQGKEIHIAAIRDISARHQIEERIDASLKEKETLLQEIHHRVKNNMQVISSLLHLQAERCNDKRTRDMLVESQNRVYVMSAVHEALHQSENLSDINLESYLTKIGTTLIHAYPKNAGKVHFTVDSADIIITLEQANPLGLIVNELICNSIKHGTPENHDLQINIKIEKQDEDIIQVIVSDDGIGFPEELDWRKAESLGLKLVRVLVESQLDGTIELQNSPGTFFTITFKLCDSTL